MLFSLQTLYCCICRTEFQTNFDGIGGYGRGSFCCSKKCHDAYQLLKSKAILGQP